jgi:hypothetical protein
MGLRLGAEVRRALCLRVAAERERERERGWAGQASAWTLMGRALTEMPLPRSRICARALSISVRLLLEGATVQWPSSLFQLGA